MTAKKTISILIIFFIISMVCLVNYFETSRLVEKIELNLIEEYFSEYNCIQQQFEAVETPEEALKIAKSVWKDKYGYEALLYKPYRVYWCEENEFWFICGSLPLAAEGGDINLLIKLDGSEAYAWKGK